MFSEPLARSDARPEAAMAPASFRGEKKSDQARRRWAVRTLRRVLGVVAVAAIAMGTFYALRPRPVPVDVATVINGRLVVEVRESGVTRVKDRYVVSAPVTGYLRRPTLESNHAVSRGQVLAELNPIHSPLLDQRSRAEAEARFAGARSGLLQAEAEHSRAVTEKELADRELLRMRKLGASSVITSQQLENAEFVARLRGDQLNSAIFAGKVAAEGVRLARAALQPNSAAATTTPLVVTAPVSGHVLRVHQASAGVVAVGTPLLELGDLSALELVVDLLTTDAVRVHPGTPVTIEGWGEERALPGSVRKVELAGFTRPSALGVDEQRTNVLIGLTAPRDMWATLGDGYRVEVRLTLWAADHVVQVPQGAVFRRGDGWAVFRIDGGVARLTPIEVGHRGDTAVEVLSGISVGETVIVSPGDRVMEGVQLAPR